MSSCVTNLSRSLVTSLSCSLYSRFASLYVDDVSPEDSVSNFDCDDDWLASVENDDILPQDSISNVSVNHPLEDVEEQGWSKFSWDDNWLASGQSDDVLPEDSISNVIAKQNVADISAYDSMVSGERDEIYPSDSASKVHATLGGQDDHLSLQGIVEAQLGSASGIMALMFHSQMIGMLVVRDLLGVTLLSIQKVWNNIMEQFFGHPFVMVSNLYSETHGKIIERDTVWSRRFCLSQADDLVQRYNGARISNVPKLTHFYVPPFARVS
eukprot:TRINITY_DN56983_c0_g1_i1.p1 TRINITY_DN56983_c0_g1~~TRINITY_DN56983_c0_g1_i1.p1  ORF type:complete len:268 (+),score=35.50 TRINITY_DN56983_c0_g1_i1:151-954(+)